MVPGSTLETIRRLRSWGYSLARFALAVLLVSALSGKLAPGVRAIADVQFQGEGTSRDTLGQVKLYIAGDCTFANHFEEYVDTRFEYPFERLGWFSEADICMVNLENPITTSSKRVAKEFNFKMHPKYLRVLLASGIDVVSLANNHTYDYGPEGLLETIRLLDSVGIRHVGAGENLEEARKPAIFEIKGIRVAFLGYFGRGSYAASASKPGVAPRVDAFVKDDIQKLKQKERVDYIVVAFHWGKEKALYPDDWQVNLAHLAVETGADLVVGHHSHVLQGIERYKGGVVAYSLGNFLFGGNSRRTYDTVVLQVELRPGKNRVSLIPIRVRDWQPYRLSGTEGEKVISTVAELSRRFPESIF